MSRYSGRPGTDGTDLFLSFQSLLLGQRVPIVSKKLTALAFFPQHGHVGSAGIFGRQEQVKPHRAEPRASARRYEQAYQLQTQSDNRFSWRPDCSYCQKRDFRRTAYKQRVHKGEAI